MFGLGKKKSTGTKAKTVKWCGGYGFVELLEGPDKGKTVFVFHKMLPEGVKELKQEQQVNVSYGPNEKGLTALEPIALLESAH